MPTNKDIIAAAFEAMARGDPRLWLDAMADDIRYEVIGETSWSQVYHGKQAFREDLGRPLMAALEPPLRMSVRRIFADGDHVVLEASGENRTKSGKPYNNRYCMVMRMQAGKVVELTEYTDTDLIVRALGERI